jgi:hypothetical protein
MCQVLDKSELCFNNIYLTSIQYLLDIVNISEEYQLCELLGQVQVSMPAAAVQSVKHENIAT